MYLAERGLWGLPQKATEPLDWKEFFAGLVQHKGLKPGEIAEMTLPELLLYTDTKKSEVTMATAVRKINVLRSLSVEHHLALARIRTRAG